MHNCSGGIIDNGSSDRNNDSHDTRGLNFGTSDDRKPVYDPGGNILNSKDGSMCTEGGGGSYVPCTLAAPCHSPQLPSFNPPPPSHPPSNSSGTSSARISDASYTANVHCSYDRDRDKTP